MRGPYAWIILFFEATIPTCPFQKIKSFFLIFFNWIFFLKYFIWSFVSLGQNLLLKFKDNCINPEQSTPEKCFPPHLYLTLINFLIFWRISFVLALIFFKSFFLIHKLSNLQKLPFFLKLLFLIQNWVFYWFYFCYLVWNKG